MPRRGALHQPHPFALGEPHQSGLRRKSRLVAVRPARAPEADEPGQQLRQIGGRNRQRPERVGKPFRQLPHHALVGERQHVGEGERGGISRTRLLADAGAVDDGDGTPALGEIGGNRDADDPGPDDDDVGIGVGHRDVRMRRSGSGRCADRFHWLHLINGLPTNRCLKPAAAPAASPARLRSPSPPPCGVRRTAAGAACARDRCCRWHALPRA